MIDSKKRIFSMIDSKKGFEKMILNASWPVAASNLFYYNDIETANEVTKAAKIALSKMMKQIHDRQQ